MFYNNVQKRWTQNKENIKEKDGGKKEERKSRGKRFEVRFLVEKNKVTM